MAARNTRSARGSATTDVRRNPGRAAKEASATIGQPAPSHSRLTRSSLAHARTKASAAASSTHHPNYLDPDSASEPVSDGASDTTSHHDQDEDSYPIPLRPAPRASRSLNQSTRVTRSSTRKHLHPDSDDEDGFAHYSKKPRRNAIDSIIADGDDDDDDEEDDEPLSMKAKSQHRWSPSKSKDDEQERTTKKPLTHPTQTASAPAPDPVILPWSALPYHIWVDIFQYALAPASDNAQWLARTSHQLCRALAEPALTALYKAPPLTKPARAHKLAALLTRPPTRTSFNYRQKVEALVIDVDSIIHRAHVGRHLDLGKLVQNCPRLSVLELRHPKDEAPYRQLDQNIRWKYPVELWHGLGIDRPTDGVDEDANQAPIRLKCWRWSSRMMETPTAIGEMQRIHASNSFRYLEKVTFVNFHIPSVAVHDNGPTEERKKELNNHFVVQFAACVSSLSAVKHVVFESCTVANDVLLKLLPASIEHLEVVNCKDVTTNGLVEALGVMGSKLQHLSLHHNRSLSLGFLPTLGHTCPSLKSLCMNLNYFSTLDNVESSNPNYDHLMLAHDVPVWPRSIEVIELEHLRKWDLAAAETLFGSLVDSAEDLQHLRCLVVRSTLDIAWRQRSRVRDEWEAKLKSVFLRDCKPPEFHPTVRSYRVPPTPPPKRPSGCEDVEIESEGEHEDDAASLLQSVRPIRRSMRLACQISLRESLSTPSLDTDYDSDHSNRRSSSSGSSGSSGPPTPSSTLSLFVHGKCDIVDFRLDNQKLKELQYDMADFMDSDGDDAFDAEWDGDIDMEYESGYAW